IGDRLVRTVPIAPGEKASKIGLEKSAAEPPPVQNASRHQQDAAVPELGSLALARCKMFIDVRTTLVGECPGMRRKRQVQAIEGNDGRLVHAQLKGQSI